MILEINIYLCWNFNPSSRLFLENGVDTAAAELIPLMSCLWNSSFSNFYLLLQESFGHQDTKGAFPQLVSQIYSVSIQH